MPRIVAQISLNCPKQVAFQHMATVEFMRAIDPNFALDTQILLETPRLIRSISKVKGIGDVEIERLLLPEISTIVTQRRPPLGPFVYQLSIQRLIDHPEGTVLQWTDEFELDGKNKGMEPVILGHLQRNDQANLEKTRQRISELQPFKTEAGT
jgi:hypothetical protein